MLWNLLFGLCILGLNKYGDYISDECPQARYTCPKICDVDHKHLPLKECKDAKTEQESKPDSTTIQSVEQLQTKAVAANKSEGL